MRGKIAGYRGQVQLVAPREMHAVMRHGRAVSDSRPRFRDVIPARRSSSCIFYQESFMETHPEILNIFLKKLGLAKNHVTKPYCSLLDLIFLIICINFILVGAISSFFLRRNRFK